MTGIAWSRIAAAAELRIVALTAELAGYLVLGVADALGGRLAAPDPEAIYLDREGRMILPSLASCSKSVSNRRLGQLLSNVLDVSVSSCLALTRLATVASREPESLDFTQELQKALIPLNRAAARRALGRLYRELEKAESSGKFSDALSRQRSLMPTSTEDCKVQGTAGQNTRSRAAEDLEVDPTQVGTPSIPVYFEGSGSDSAEAKLADTGAAGSEVPDLLVPRRVGAAPSEDLAANRPPPETAFGLPAREVSRIETPGSRDQTYESARLPRVTVGACPTVSVGERFRCAIVSSNRDEDEAASVALACDPPAALEQLSEGGGTQALYFFPAPSETPTVRETTLVMAPVVVESPRERTLPLPVATTTPVEVAAAVVAEPFSSHAPEPTQALPLVRRRPPAPLSVQLESNEGELAWERTAVDACVEVSDEEVRYDEVPPKLVDTSTGCSSEVSTIELARDGFEEFPIELDPCDLVDDPDFAPTLGVGLEAMGQLEPISDDQNRGTPFEKLGFTLEPSAEDAIELVFDEIGAYQGFSGDPDGAKSLCLATRGQSGDIASGHVDTHYGSAERIAPTQFSSIEGLSSQFSLEPLWSEQELSHDLRIVAGLEKARDEFTHTPPPTVNQLELVERPEQMEPTRRLGRARGIAAGALALLLVVLGGRFFDASVCSTTGSPMSADPLGQICRAAVSVAGVEPELRIQLRQKGDPSFREPTRVVGETVHFAGLRCGSDAELLVLDAGLASLRRIPISSESLTPRGTHPSVQTQLRLN